MNEEIIPKYSPRTYGVRMALEKEIEDYVRTLIDGRSRLSVCEVRSNFSMTLHNILESYLGHLDQMIDHYQKMELERVAVGGKPMFLKDVDL